MILLFCVLYSWVFGEEETQTEWIKSQREGIDILHNVNCVKIV